MGGASGRCARPVSAKLRPLTRSWTPPRTLEGPAFSVRVPPWVLFDMSVGSDATYEHHEADSESSFSRCQGGSPNAPYVGYPGRRRPPPPRLTVGSATRCRK